MGKTCMIAGPSARCTIHVLGYENPAAQDPSDANWLSCHVAVRSNESLSAETAAAFGVQDFIVFAEDLGRVLQRADGAVSFNTDEDALSLRIELRKTGNATVSGTLRLTGNARIALSFFFESDQTFLLETQLQLEEIAQSFPIRCGSSPTQANDAESGSS